MKSDDPLKYFRTDQPWIEQLESLRTDHPFDQRWSKWSQQQQKKNRNRAMILVLSGALTMSLAFGSLVPAYAEPILEPKIGKEPSFPHEHLIQKHLFHRFHSEPLLHSRSEPSESPVLRETPKDTEFQPKPSEKEEEPILDKSEPIAEKVEKKEEPQEVDQPIETKKEPEHTTAPVKEPTTTVHAEPASIQTFSAKGAHESQPLKRVKEISSPSAKEAEQPVAVNTDSIPSKEIDNTPLQKTENGGTLPKTAGDSVSIAIFGLLLIAGGGQLEAARRMWLKHV